MCCAGFINCVWEVNGPDWWQTPLMNSVLSPSCLIGMNQFISWLIFSLWLCCRFGGVREQPANAGTSPGNADASLNTRCERENFDVAVWQLSPAQMINTVEAAFDNKKKGDARQLKRKRAALDVHVLLFLMTSLGTTEWHNERSVSCGKHEG